MQCSLGIVSTDLIDYTNLLTAMKLTSLKLFITLLCCSVCTNGLATIFPPKTTPACLGDQLQLTCNTTGNLLKWSFYENGSNILHMLTIQRLGESDQMHQFYINSVSYTFIRISIGGSLPLISNLTISPVTRDLNGTEINCEDQDTGEFSSTVISIILNDPQLVIFDPLLERFESTGITVMIKWMEESPFYLYHITVFPQAEIIFAGRDQVQLNILYNIFYNVSVVASSPCGLDNATNTTEIFFTSCRNVTLNLADNLIAVAGYQSPAVEGTNVTFTCSPGLELTGSSISTCTGNGEWEPDPMDINCSRTVIHIESSTPMSEGLNQIAIVSSMTVFSITSSITLFIFGLFCGRYCCKRKVAETYSQEQNSIPCQHEHCQLELIMNQNEAYGPIQ